MRVNVPSTLLKSTRPLTRLDYFLGKLGVIGALVAAVAVLPAALAYFVGVCFSLDLTVVRDTYTVLLASVAYGLVITLSTGALMLALSSLSRRSLYIAIAFESGFEDLSSFYRAFKKRTGLAPNRWRRERRSG